MTDLLSEITFCDECPYSGEPNGCNRKEGTCKAYESYFDLVEENATLRERLEKAIELPCKIGDTVYKVDDKCKARQEFDNLPKYGVTDYEMEEAANKERIYGVWDRETNNY